MRRKQDSRRSERVTLVAELFGLGLSTDDISTLTLWSRGTILHDLSTLGGENAFPKRPRRKNEVFAAILGRYATLCTVRSTTDVATNADLRMALAAWLRENEILAMLDGVKLTLRRLQIPAYPMDRQAHAQLLGKICGISLTEPNSADLVATRRDEWGNLLSAIHSGEQKTPDSRDQIDALLARAVLEKERPKIMPMWNEDLFVAVDKLLEILGPHEYAIVMKGTSEIPDATIHRLRQEMHRRNLDIFTSPIQMTLGEAFETWDKRRRFMAKTGIEDLANPMLLEEVEELGLSIRPANSVRQAGITLIGELVQWTRIRLLQNEHFTRKTVEEIRERLTLYGLRLDMRLNPQLQQFLEQRKRELAGTDHSS